MKRLSEYLFLGTLGGILYYSFEMLFRGFSHWSMFVLGGICFLFFAQQGLWTEWEAPLWKQVGWCVLFVTAAEFITGIIVNKLMGWHVWDYTDQPFSDHGTDLSAFYGHFFRPVCGGILLSGVSASFPVRGETSAFSCAVGGKTGRSGCLNPAVEVDSQKCYNTSAENLSSDMHAKDRRAFRTKE